MKRLRILSAILATGLLSVPSAHAVTVYYQPTPYPSSTQSQPGTHVKSGWFNNSFNQTLVWDDKLQIGGWDDYYTSPIKFDITGLPSDVSNAQLYLYALPSGSAGPSQVSIYRISDPWEPATIGWGNFPYVDNGYYWPVSTAVNTWRSYTITEWYTAWKNGTHANYGMLLWPYNNDGTQRFDKFVSSKSTDDGKRPLLRLDFTPTLEMKMPLPGNLSWAVTTEVGGFDCTTDPQDTAHADTKYFSIDFSWRNRDSNGSIIYPDPNVPASNTNIPILAAAGGKVRFAGGNNTNDPNGYHVVIDHDYDDNPDTGFSTWYVHLKTNPTISPSAFVYTGKPVQQGDQIGIMGTTGKYWDSQSQSWKPSSVGVHLHFGVKYGNGTANSVSGAATIPELTKVVMDGWILKSFQSECINGTYGRYYRSGNRTY